MAKSLVREAARTHRLTSGRGLLEHLFAKAFEGLVYAQIWEDPRVDLAALEVDSTTRLLTIASGGCNAMSYLMADPARVVAVDLNPAHIALLRLKLAAARHLDGHEDFFGLFGAGSGARNGATYTALRTHLDDTTRAYWDGRNFRGRRRFTYLQNDLYSHGLLGRCIAAGHLVARLHGRRVERLLDARSIEDQRRLFDEVIAPIFDNPLVRAAARLPVSYFGLGIPPAQFDALQVDASGSLATLVRARVERLACDFPFEDNYFAWQAFGRGYDPARRSLPPYLEPASFPALKARAHKVEPCLASVTDQLALEPANALDAFVLLDAQDWMNAHQLRDLWSQINRTAAPGARVIFRTAGESSPLPAMLAPDLLAPWRYEAARSRELHAQDRSAIYGGFHLYRRVRA